ncbi:endo alpha-1,4 polygalactosaminidase [Magnetovibrio sp.]|uniref:endo alpha-1,4 polygalactosaminidase n=1 Tax=Magnetovibrio sp. TaxID=2024836 RepID=UPI002F94D155
MIWRPDPGDTFDWQLSEPFDFKRPVDILDLDLFDAPPDTIALLKSKGTRLVCYINVGAWEDWRRDADAFPPAVLGNNYSGWVGERWLDIRAIDALAPVLRARFDLCRDKGFDAIEPDNINGFDNDTGFNLTRDDQISFNLWLAQEAHARGLSIALKNAPELLPELGAQFDWALLEDCHVQGWCDAFEPFVHAAKAVIAVEYSDQVDALRDWADICARAAQSGVQTVLKNRELDSWLKTCE